jgi:hypothetical protein
MWAVVVAAVVLAGCHPAGASRPTSSADRVGYPRCVAFNDAGNSVTCSAPARVYQGEACACADGKGHSFFGRVQEAPR